MRILLDMDGVLADFVGGISKAHGRPSPYTSPAAYGYWEMQDLWGITVQEFYAPGNSHEFWAGLAPTDNCFEIIKMACDKVGQDNVGILTAPNRAPGCVTGKEAWIHRHAPYLYKNLFYGRAKGFIASPDHILIDDKDSNVDSFRAAGGHGVLVPRLWNRNYPLAPQSTLIIKEILASINN